MKTTASQTNREINYIIQKAAAAFERNKAIAELVFNQSTEELRINHLLNMDEIECERLERGYDESVTHHHDCDSYAPWLNASKKEFDAQCKLNVKLEMMYSKVFAAEEKKFEIACAPHKAILEKALEDANATYHLAASRVGQKAVKGLY
jgi:hypothetical protein